MRQLMLIELSLRSEDNLPNAAWTMQRIKIHVYQFVLFLFVGTSRLPIAAERNCDKILCHIYIQSYIYWLRINWVAKTGCEASSSIIVGNITPAHPQFDFK